MWKRCSEGQRWTGETCKGDAESYRFSIAKRVAKDSDFAGHSDWRLPTLKELQSLVVCSIGKKKAFSAKQDRSMSSRLQGGIQDGGCTGTMSEMKEQRPTINKSKFPRTASFRYWSSTSSKTGAAWIVNFHHGGSKGEQDFYSPDKEIAKIRLVRKVQ